MRNYPSAVLAAIDQFAAQEEFLINLGEDKARIMADLVSKEQPKVFVEIGGYMGYSAILIADAMRGAHPDANAGELRLWSLELDPLYAAIAMNLVDLAGLRDIVRVVTGAAGESLARLKDEGKLVGRIDMLLLDHVEDLYIQEFETCEKLGLLAEGSVVVADNVVRPGAPEYREMVRRHPGLESYGIRGLIIPGEFEVCIHACSFTAWA
jgi:catechol O-methyltransferase